MTRSSIGSVRSAAPGPRFARPKPENALDSGRTISRLGVTMAHMLNAGKSVVFAFAAPIRTR
ncbi:MAG: hypothetical protein QOI27_2699 [Gaiellaceae bacterium]|jgi:hypothetical protein|nr:hypothetical protein [Gaiellaceae bacterium]MDX6471881.1 hypothetical protein [Gaiellaceae bacterium]